MRHRFALMAAAFILILGFGIPAFRAQNAVPQTYSFMMDPAMSLMGPSIVKVMRDGPKEAVDQILPVGPGREKEFHNHILYDFQAHKIYTRIVSDPSVPCSVMNYTSPAAPAEFDLITGSADMLKDMAAHKDQTKELGTETVNGIPAKVLEATSDQGKAKIWLAVKGGFPVKVVSTPPGGTEMIFVEMKQLSFTKPPASAFTPPTGCTAIKGEATATGVHAEIGAGTESEGGKPTTNVTAVTLQEVPEYKGACPAHIKLVGTITVDGPGKVFYQFGAGTFEKGETIAFAKAGTKTVSQVMTFNPEFGGGMGVSAILEAVGEDASGKHGMFIKGSNNADFSIYCTSGGKSAGEEEKPSAGSTTPNATAIAQVTEVQVEVVPADYSGPCPTKVKLVGTLTADGPGTAYYQFQAGAIGANREGTIEVKAAGKQTVTSEGQLRRTPQVKSVRFLAGMEPRGHQENAKWADAELNLSCGGTK